MKISVYKSEAEFDVVNNLTNACAAADLGFLEAFDNLIASGEGEINRGHIRVSVDGDFVTMTIAGTSETAHKDDIIR